MALGSSFMVWCCFIIPACANCTQFNNATSLVHNYTTFLKFKKIQSRISRETPFLTLYNLAVNNCVYECQIRPDCRAVNFWRLRKQCDILSNDTSILDCSHSGHPCVYIRKSDVKESPCSNLLSICPPCNSTEACDVDTGQCVIRECRKNEKQNTTHVGNILSVGSLITIVCDKWFVPTSYIHGQRTPTYRSYCQNDGQWSNVPQCVYRFDCGIPPEFPFASAVWYKYVGKPSKETNLAVYWCHSGYAAPRYSNTMTLVCLYTIFGGPGYNNISDSRNYNNISDDPRNYYISGNYSYSYYNISGDPSYYNISWDYINVTWAEPQFQCIRNCREPNEIPNARVSEGENLENMTKTYYCSPGYVLNYTYTWNETLELSTRCQPNGKWTTTNFECTPVCGNNTEIENGYSTSLFEDDNRIFLNYTCHKNYAMADRVTNTVVECLNGTWEDPDFRCVRNCYQPPEIVHATLIAGNTLEGTTRVYTCHPGYYENDTTAASTTCLSDGNWTSPMFQCDTVCGPVPVIANGYLIDTATDGDRTLLEYTCNEGYVKISDIAYPSVECLNGMWDKTDLGCLRDCSEPPAMPKATVTLGGGTLEGAERKYECNPGFVLNGTGTVTCQPDGNWLGDFECIAVCLTAPPSVTNAVVSPGDNVVGTARDYTCASGYGVPPNVSATSTCLADGNWSPPAFTCILKTCEAGWTQLGPSCYYVKQPYQYLPVDAARTYCYDKGAYVMQLETSEENIAVKTFLSAKYGAKSWWVGMTDEGTEGTWRWLETDGHVIFLDWNYNEPDGATVENYAIMWNTYAWADVPWDAPYTPVCEKGSQVIV